jgi:hypothetical protein
MLQILKKKYPFKIINIILILLTFTVCSYKKSSTFKEIKFTLFYTSNIKGTLFSCGCQSNALGGLPKIISTVYDMRKIYTSKSIFVNTGELFLNKSIRSSLFDNNFIQNHIRIILESMSSVVLDIKFLDIKDRKFYKFYTIEKFFNHYNIRTVGLWKSFNSNKITKKEYCIFNFNNIIVGFIQISSCDKSLYGLIKKVNRCIYLMRFSGVDIVIVISNISKKIMKEINSAIYGMSVIIINSAKYSHDKNAYKQQSAVYVNMPGYSKYIGVIDFHFFYDKYIKKMLTNMKNKVFPDLRKIYYIKLYVNKLQYQESYTFSGHSLDKLQLWKQSLSNTDKSDDKIKVCKRFVLTRTIPIKKSIGKSFLFKYFFDNYTKNIGSHDNSFNTNFVDQPFFIGQSNCIKCHTIEKTHISISQDIKSFNHKHLKAFKTLIDINKADNKKCIKCHIVGWLEPGGIKFNETQDNWIYNVQCESCHGPGSLHFRTISKIDIEKNITEYRCRICHQKPHIEGFNSFSYLLVS